MIDFKVDKNICLRCGLCVSDCVVHIIEQDADSLPFVAADNEERCLGCQHCLAVCEPGAISILGKNPMNSRLIDELSFPSLDQMDNLVRSRRSIRRYKDQNIDAGLLDGLLTSLAYSPTGVNAQELAFNVIDDKDDMKQFQGKLLDMLGDAKVRERIVSERPRYRALLSQSREAIAAQLFRTAPHAIFISAPANSPCPEADVPLALAYFELLATSAGLGTVWWGMFKFIAEALPEAKSLVGIPEDHLYYAMLFGVPDVVYTRLPQKDDAMKVNRLTF